MVKKLQIVLSIMLIMVLLIVSCAPKPTVAPPVVVEEKKPPVVAPPEAVPTTGEKSVDEVATDVSDALSVDDELDTSELDDIDSILADIENI